MRGRLVGCALGALGTALGLGTLGFGLFVRSLGEAEVGVATMEPVYVRFDSSTPLAEALARFAEEGALASPDPVVRYARLTGRDQPLQPGTYFLLGAVTAEQVLRRLRQPLTRFLRIPEGWWVDRVAQRLEAELVAPRCDYVRLAAQPSRFAADVGFDLPEGSLEGYLFPDTYDLPPLLGAEGTIRRQLRAFERKVLPILPEGADLHRVLTVASMVELETALDEERARVAGVIENRLRRRMRLEIDATVLYALQEWRPLGPGVVRTVRSPYNTYLNEGLPPGPIGSPGLASVRAALEPERHGFLFYVARPDRSHYFASTYEEHRANIRRARAEARAAAGIE